MGYVRTFAANRWWRNMGGARTTSVTASRRVGLTGPAAGVRAGGQPLRVDPPDLVSIYAERLRASADAPPLFAPRPVVRIGRGTPAFRRHRPARSSGQGAATQTRLSRRGRLVAVAATVAVVVTTALAGTVLAG